MLIEYEMKTVHFKVEEKSLKIMMYESVNLLNEKKLFYLGLSGIGISKSFNF